MTTNPARRLAVGVPTVVTIQARELWNDTGIQVRVGDSYSLTAKGEWTDWFVTTKASGVATNKAPLLARLAYMLFEKRRRMRHENWFALIGAVGLQEASGFLIGEQHPKWEPAESGTLACFANDVPSAYGNNKGAIALTVTLLSARP